jgi:hypothetical protein
MAAANIEPLVAKVLNAFLDVFAAYRSYCGITKKCFWSRHLAAATRPILQPPQKFVSLQGQSKTILVLQEKKISHSRNPFGRTKEGI